MNANRKDFTMPLGHVRITDNYILGLIEGDGSFYLYKSKYYTYISIGMESVNRFLFEKIRHYLIKQMDFYSQLYAINTKAGTIAIVDQKGTEGTRFRKPFSILQINQISCLICIIY